MSYGLGRNISTIDTRDLDLALHVKYKSNLTKQLWGFNHVALDQNGDPFCGGFSMAHYGMVLPTDSDYTNEQAKQFYEQCKVTDFQPGMRNGTSCRSIALTGQRLKMWKNYAFAKEATTVYDWLLTEGPIIFGTNWYNDMFLPDENFIIHCNGALAGGHAWVGIGVDLQEQYLDGLTSWGPNFGNNGKFRIPLKEFERIFGEQGEAIAAVELGKVDPSLPAKGCYNTKIGRMLTRILK
jgi:hypothetical protein